MPGFILVGTVPMQQVVCHGIPGGMPDGLGREVADGDVVSIDVSVYTAAGFFGDNCRTYIAGEYNAHVMERFFRCLIHVEKVDV